MPTTHHVYQLEYDYPDAPSQYATEMALSTAREHILPNTHFDTVTTTDCDPARLDTERGESYLNEAFETSRDTLCEALNTIYTEFTRVTPEHHFKKCDSDSNSDVACVSHDAIVNAYDELLASNEFLRAVIRLGEQHGVSRHVYGLRYGHGIASHRELTDHLDLYGPDTTSDEYVVVVPLTLKKQ